MVSIASTERVRGVIAPSVGGSLKRKQYDADLDLENISSSQLKRRRVTFDPAVDVHILPDVNEKSLELVGEEVRRALERHAIDENTTYDEIRALLQTKPTSADAPLTGLLQKYIIALANNVPSLDYKCTGLVHAVVDSSWVARNEQYVRVYRHFLRSLLSVHPGYTTTVLKMLVNMFVKLPSPHLRQQDDPATNRAHIQDRVHDTIKFLVRQSAMTSTYLAPLLTSAFPFPTDTAKAHVHYVRNILRVSKYCPELKGEILSLITDKLVKIDVQIQVDMERLDEDVEEQLLQEAADDIEDEEEDMSDNDSVSSEESLDEEERHIKEVKESVTKLDAIMDILFSYYDAIFARGDAFAINEAFQSMLSHFARIILPNYRSRHTQFLLFHFSQTSPDLIQRFTKYCSDLAFNLNQPRIHRIAAAAYLASFIARGAHVSGAIVRSVFDELCDHMEMLRLFHEPECKGPDLRLYDTYYAISQALLYAFCFRWRDLIVTSDRSTPTDSDILYHEGDFTWHRSVQKILHNNIFSKLNPLKICSPIIVAQFAGIAHHLNFEYVFSILETNKRIRLARRIGHSLGGVAARETALTMKKGEGSFLLESFFPFDPYKLPRSKRWIQNEYMPWKSIPGMKPSPAEEEDLESEEEDDDDDADEDDDSSDSEAGGHARGLHDEEDDDLDDGLETDESS
jgi:RNA polymerase I-specific transcription initiation factor RRN3